MIYSVYPFTIAKTMQKGDSMPKKAFSSKTSQHPGRFVSYLSFCLLIIFTPLVSNPALGARHTLVEFGDSLETTSTPYTDWDEVLWHSTYTRFVDADGAPAHDGIAETSSTPDRESSYFGVRGTAPVDFQPGMKIIATFYNNSAEEQYFGCRVSFEDPDNPDPSQSSLPWRTMVSADETDTPYLAVVSANSLAEMQFYITDADMVSSPDTPAAAGNRYLVNINLAYADPNNDAIVLTKIEWSDDADITPPSVPQDLTAQMVSTSAGVGASVVKLTWSPCTDPGTNATGLRAYLIYRNGALYDMVTRAMADHLGSNLHWLDIEAAPSSSYTYAVSAIDDAPFGMYPIVDHPDRRRGNESALSDPVAVNTPSWQASDVINPFDAMDYQGAFRLPDDDGMGEEWAYAHRGLTFYPGGNSGYNPASELPGSLFAVKLNDEIGEISIPIPVDSDNAGDLPRATTLQDPVDLWPEIYSGSSTPEGGADKTLAIGYHPAANGIDEQIYYTVSNYYGTDPDAPCMGRFDLDLTEGVGAWHVGAAPPNNVFPGLISAIMFSAPETWAATHTGGRSLIVGNTYISGSSVPSNGPSLYAVAPWETGALPANGGYTNAVELLKYGASEDYEHRSINYSWDEFGQGGAWLTTGSQSAVAISYRRSVGDTWYGYDNGVQNCEYDIPEPPFGSHGTGATDWEASLLFYNPADLEDVASGAMDSWDPLPYACYNMAPFSLVENGGARAGAIAYDSNNGYIYFIDHNGDPGYEYGYSIIHAWRIMEKIGYVCSTADCDCNGNQPCATSITQAAATFDPGTVIRVAEGTYEENVTIGRDVVVQLCWNSDYSAMGTSAVELTGP